MGGFTGFPEGKLEMTSLPELFFSELLPAIDDLSELKVTLHCLWLVQCKQGDVRYTTASELLSDRILMRGLEGAGLSAGEALQEGLERAVARGTLLQVTVQRARRPDEKLYFVNGERGRAAVARIENGEWTPPDDDEIVHLEARRPNIFNLYEQNFGLIQSSILADELKDAEQTFPPDWIEDAFRIAVGNNARKWAYVRSILDRWAREGRAPRRQGDAQQERRRYVEGEYADHIKH